MTRPFGLLEVALAAAERGWPVFPLRPGQKRPALHGATLCAETGVCAGGHRGWEQRATTDPDRIRGAWSAGPFNVGLPPGRAGLVVVDLDTADPSDPDDVPPAEWAQLGIRGGADVLAVLAERAGQPVPATYSVACPPIPSGGDAQIADWLDHHPDARLVVIDVLVKVRGNPPPGMSAYDADYQAMSRIKRIADHPAIGAGDTSDSSDTPAFLPASPLSLRHSTPADQHEPDHDGPEPE